MFILEFGCVWRVSLIRVEKWKKNKREGNEKEGGRGINREEERERYIERKRGDSCFTLVCFCFALTFFEKLWSRNSLGFLCT